MNFLLVGINAKYIHSNPAIFSLAAYAGKSGLMEHLSLAEFTINQQEEQILSEIYEREADAVAFSCYIWNAEMVSLLIDDLHKLKPDLDIWLGGPEVSFDPDKQFQKFPFLKGVMIGEGEESFREVLEAYVETEKKWLQTEAGSLKTGQFSFYLENSILETIAGLYLKTGYTAMRDCLDMDEIPFFYRCDLGNSYHGLRDFENRVIYYESSRGCPFRCSYCLSSIEKQLRFRSLSLVKEELQFFLDHKVPQVKFIDRTFNAKHEHCMAIWKFIKEHDNGITNFHFEISADLLKEEEIELLQSMREGLVQLEIGVQTTNAKTITAIRRTMNLEKVADHVKTVNEAGNIHQHLDLIAGLPYEDYDSFHQSFNDVYKMQPQQLQLGFLKVLKGSYMEEMAEEYGLVYHTVPPYEVMYTKWLPFEDVLRLKQIEEMVELFYNSRQFTHSIYFLEYMYGDAFSMFENLANFYKKEGYFLNSSKRIAHYEHFLKFINEKFPEEEALFKELLILDCYLRENMKTYPEFATGHEASFVKSSELQKLSQYEKDYGRIFYKTEEKERKYLPNLIAYDSKQMAKMTHMEFFRFPVWEWNAAKLQEIYKNSKDDLIEEALHPVLFDYTSRHYTTSFCRTLILEDEYEIKEK